MKLDVIPETLPERLALRAGLVPRPFLQTLLAGGMARPLFDSLAPTYRS